ncbi:MAG: LptF/LptG family permease [Gemmatimonadaceae bacterium]|nr:LptF/LptG family permease [Gemmatimonadaceae bacterium]
MTHLYRLALYLLPRELRRKHGAEMAFLFAAELGHARERGRWAALLAGLRGMCDAITRGAYERVRSPGGPPSGTDAEPPTTAQLLVRLSTSFTVAVVALTSVFLFQYAPRQIPALQTRGLGGDTIAQALWLSVPFTVALTIPMAVFVAVLQVFTRLGANGVLSSATRRSRGARRLMAPTVAASAVVALLALGVTTRVLPGANKELITIQQGRVGAPNARAMTVDELRAAARNAAHDDVAELEVEIQKKFALPAACVVLAMVAMAIAWSMPRGGTLLVSVASVTVLGAYYALIMVGEALADQLVVSPVLAMWGANGLLLAVVLLFGWRRRMRTA